MIKKPIGYATITLHGKVVKEFDTLTCGHCNKIYCSSTNSPEATPDLGGMCKICGAMVCSPCLAKLMQEGCFPFEKKLDWYEQGKFKEMMEMGISLRTGGSY